MGNEITIRRCKLYVYMYCATWGCMNSQLSSPYLPKNSAGESFESWYGFNFGNLTLINSSATSGNSHCPAYVKFSSPTVTRVVHLVDSLSLKRDLIN